MRHIVIIGATSAIAMAAARRFAADGARFLLAARDADKLAAVADDLRVAGGGAVAVDTARHAPASPVFLPGRRSAVLIWC